VSSSRLSPLPIHARTLYTHARTHTRTHARTRANTHSSPHCAQVGFRQLVKAILNQRISPARDASGTSKKHPDHSQLVWSPLSDTYGWDLLFHEALGGVQNETWLRPGECVRTYHRFAPELNQD
jgi:hypothetical protein